MYQHNTARALSVVLLFSCFSLMVFGKTREQMLEEHRQDIRKQLRYVNHSYKETVVSNFEKAVQLYSNKQLEQQQDVIEQVKGTMIYEFAEQRARQVAQQFAWDSQQIKAFVEAYVATIFEKQFNNEQLGDIYGNDLQNAAHNHFRNVYTSCPVCDTKMNMSYLQQKLQQKKQHIRQILDWLK